MRFPLRNNPFKSPQQQLLNQAHPVVRRHRLLGLGRDGGKLAGDVVEAGAAVGERLVVDARAVDDRREQFCVAGKTRRCRRRTGVERA